MNKFASIFLLQGIFFLFPSQWGYGRYHVKTVMMDAPYIMQPDGEKIEIRPVIQSSFIDESHVFRTKKYSEAKEACAKLKGNWFLPPPIFHYNIDVLTNSPLEVRVTKDAKDEKNRQTFEMVSTGGFMWVDLNSHSESENMFSLVETWHKPYQRIRNGLEIWFEDSDDQESRVFFRMPYSRSPFDKWRSFYSRYSPYSPLNHFYSQLTKVLENGIPVYCINNPGHSLLKGAFRPYSRYPKPPSSHSFFPFPF